MTNSQTNIAFLNAIDTKVKNDILTNIANHYVITLEQAYDEVTHEEAESIMDYLTEPVRSNVSQLFKRHQYAK